jgi:hypothetical protein
MRNLLRERSAVVLAAAVLPIPIGVGPRFHPAPGVHGACVAASLAAGSRVHLELFAARRVVIVPAGIGLRGRKVRFGRVVAARCRARVWTTDPTGVVRFTGSATLGDVFDVWGRTLQSEQLLSFHGRVRLYRNGARALRDVRGERLRDGDELVLEVGPYVPPHRSFRFPP